MSQCSLGQRHLQPEVMDQPGLDPAEHERALRALVRINALSNTAGILWGPVRKLARRAPRPLRVLDVACGGGDVLLGLWHRSRKAGVALQLEGCDRSPVALAHAVRQAEQQQAPIRFFQWDAIHDPLPDPHDVVTTSLFLHHLGNAEASLVLRRLAAVARSLLLVSDLERGPLGWLLAWLAARLLTRSPVVHVDAPLSVEGAFTCAEVRALARQAGLTGVRIRRRWPCRYLLSWQRGGVEITDAERR